MTRISTTMGSVRRSSKYGPIVLLNGILTSEWIPGIELKAESSVIVLHA